MQNPIKQFLHSSSIRARVKYMAMNSTAAQLILRSRTVLLLDTAYYSNLINTSLVISIVRTLQTKHVYNDFAFFISTEIDGHTNIGLDFFMPFARTFAGTSNIIIRRFSHTPHISLAEVLDDTSLVMVLTTGVKDAIMPLAAHSLTRARRLRTIFLYYPIHEYHQYGNTVDFRLAFRAALYDLNAWIWRKQFTSVIILTIANHVYLQNPYPVLQLVNKTGIWRAADFFVDHTQNLQGFVLRSPVFYDMPRVFFVRDKRNYNISGSSGRLFMTFLEHINATLLDVTPAEPENMQLFYFLDKIRKEECDLLIHSFTAMLPIKTGQSYPIGINDWCVMMPYRSDNPEHQYIFTWGMWLMVFSCVLYISIVIWRSRAIQPDDYMQALLQTIASICSISYVALLKQQTRRSRYFYVMLFILGFFLTNTYISKLSSNLTATIRQKQIDTVADAIAAQCKIMVMQFEYDRLAYTHPPEFMQLLIVVEKFQLDLLRDRLNTSYGYSVTTDRWQIYARQQHFSKKKLFHLSKICMGPFSQVFPMQYDSHLMQRFNDFLLNIFQMGLIRYWEDESYLDALHMKYVKLIESSDDGAVPLRLGFYRYALWLLYGGMLLATVVFLGEWRIQWMLRKWKKWQKSKASKRVVEKVV